MMKLEGRVALITGAGSGIGAASARHMAKEGAHIAVTGIPADGVDEVAEEIRTFGGKAVGIPTDVSDSEQVDDAVARTVREFGRLDVAVASAGIQLHNEDRDLHKMDEAAWDRTLDVNFRGVFLTCKYALAQFMEQGDGGSIVIISSVTALSGGSANVAYLSSKHGLLGLNRYIAVHYGAQGIRCNCICPGAMEKTPNWDDHPDPKGREQKLLHAIPSGRIGVPEDIAPWVTFLASEDAGYANGANIVVDGGLSA
jgi:NAD(P)-dependent dehydrogenase (short-subunit alcohol dehydrogenase family)